MLLRRQQPWLKSRAALAVLLITLGWLAVPVSLAAQESDVCEMECCVADGHCCCAAHRTYVAGQVPDGGDVVTGPEIFAACPAKCAPASTTVNSVVHVAEQPRPRLLEFALHPEANFAFSSQLHSHPELDSAPSRAPPVTLL